MGEILGLGMSHYPGMRVISGGPAGLANVLNRPDIPDEAKDPANWPEGAVREFGEDEGREGHRRHKERFVEECKILRHRLDEFNPDFVLIWGDDQYENFKEDIIPPFCVLAYDDMEIYPYHGERDLVDPNAPMSQFTLQDGQEPPPNPWDESKDTLFKIKGKREAAKFLAQGLIEEKIDIAYAYRPLHHSGWAHAFLNTVMFLDWNRTGFDYPSIAFQVNCYGSRVIVNRGGTFPVDEDPSEVDLDPEGPTPERCMEVGAAVARVLERSPWRVAVIASSSWSHAFLTPKTHFLFPDVEADRKLYDALVAGDYDYWRSISNEQVADSGQQEVRNWWTFMGAMEALGHKTPTYHNYIESYTMNSNKCFAVYEPR